MLPVLAVAEASGGGAIAVPGAQATVLSCSLEWLTRRLCSSGVWRAVKYPAWLSLQRETVTRYRSVVAWRASRTRPRAASRMLMDPGDIARACVAAKSSSLRCRTGSSSRGSGCTRGLASASGANRLASWARVGLGRESRNPGTSRAVDADTMPSAPRLSVRCGMRDRSSLRSRAAYDSAGRGRSTAGLTAAASRLLCWWAATASGDAAHSQPSAAAASCRVAVLAPATAGERRLLPLLAACAPGTGTGPMPPALPITLLPPVVPEPAPAPPAADAAAADSLMLSPLAPAPAPAWPSPAAARTANGEAALCIAPEARPLRREARAMRSARSCAARLGGRLLGDSDLTLS